jgi:hypothetical protein
MPVGTAYPTVIDCLYLDSSRSLLVLVVLVQDMDSRDSESESDSESAAVPLAVPRSLNFKFTGKLTAATRRILTQTSVFITQSRRRGGFPADSVSPNGVLVQLPCQLQVEAQLASESSSFKLNFKLKH